MIAISKYSNTITYNLRTTLDNTGLSQLQAQLAKTQQQIISMQSQELLSPNTANKALADINKVSTALQKSFNANLGMLDISKVTKNLGKDVNLKSLQQSFELAGAEGQKAFLDVLGSLGKLDTGVKATSSLVDKMFNTMGNTVRWGIMSSAFNGVTNSIRQATDYVKELDNSLTQIQLVTSYSKDDMNQYAKSANEAARALGSTTTAMTNATLLFAQSGFSLNQSNELAQLSTKLANASQQDTATTSDQIMAYMNAYGLDKNLSQLQSAMDSWAEVANVSAADVKELAEASQKAASSAATLGVSTDQLNAQIATIESVTREAPEQIGNGLKTLYARFSDLKTGKTLDDSITLGTVTKQLQGAGVNVFDQNNNMRDVGNIIEDLMKVWAGLDTTQKAGLSQSLAGKYQVARFQALMNRSDLYNQYKGASENASGTLDVMNEKYVNSLEGRMNKLQASAENLFDDLFDTEDFYAPVDALTQIVDLTDQFVNALGGVKGMLSGIAPIATQVFAKNIGNGISSMLYNRDLSKIQANNKNQAYAELKKLGINDVTDERYSDIVNLIKGGQSNASIMNPDAQKTYNSILQDEVALKKEAIDLEVKLQKSVDATNAAYKLRNRTLAEDVSLIRDENGNITGVNTGGLQKYSERYGSGAQFKYDHSAVKQEDFALYKSDMSNIDESFARDLQPLQFVANDSKKYRDSADQLNAIYKLAEGNQASDALDYIMKTSRSFNDMNKVENSHVADAAENLLDLLTSQDVEVVELQEAFKQLEQAIEAVNKTANDYDSNMVKTDEDLTKLSSQLIQVDSLFDSAKERGAAFIKSLDFANAISKTLEFAGALGNLAFVYQQIQSIGDIWDDDDLTSGEKLLQTLMSIGTIAPMLAQSFSTFKDIFKVDSLEKLANDVSEVADAVSMSKKGDSASIKENTKDELENAAAKAASTKAKQESAEASLEEAAADKVDTAATAENSATEAENAAAKAASNAAETANNAAEVVDDVTDVVDAAGDAAGAAETVAEATEGIAAGGVAAKIVSGFGEITGAVGALASAFGSLIVAAAPWIALGAGVAAVGYSIWYSINHLAIEADRAQKKADDLAKSAADVATEYQEIQNSYQNLKDSIANYKESQEALDKLEKGTRDWKDELIAVNDEVLKLLQAYPELQKYVYKDTNGKLTISDEGLDNLQDKMAQNVAYGALAVAKTQQDANQAQVEANNKEVQANVTFQGRGTKTVTDSAGRKRSYITNGTRSISDNELDAVYDMLRYNGVNSINKESDIKEALEIAGQNSSDAIVDAIVDNGDKIVGAFRENEQLNTQNRQLLENAAQQALNNTAGYDSSQKNNDAVVAMVASQAANLTDKYYSEFSGMKSSDLGELYAQQNGWTFNKEKNGTFTFTDALGQEQQVSKEVLTNYLAASKAMTEASSNWVDTASIVAQISNSAAGSKYGTDLVNAVASGNKQSGFDLSGMDVSEIFQLQNDSDSITADYLGISDEAAKAAGFKNGEQYAKAFADAIKSYKIDDKTLFENGWDDQKISSELANVGESAEKLEEYKTNLVGTNQAFAKYGDNVSKNNADLQEQNEQLQKANKNLDASSDEWKQNKARIDANNKSIKQNNQNYDELTAKLVVMQNGMEDLNKIFADTENPLQGLAESSADYTSKIEELADATGKMLNIDMSNWTLDQKSAFVANNLDKIREAANGDVEALQALRREAANQILINAGINPNSSADIYNSMSSIIDYVNNNIPDIEAGATINEGPFIDGLRTMLSEGQYTTQQLQVLFKALEGLGVDFEIAYQPATISLPQITQMVKSNISGKKSKSMGEALGQVVGTTVSAISQSIMVPTIKSVTRTPNSGGGSSYRSPSGGGHGSNAGGGSGGGGGGGGGGGSSYTPQENKEIESEIDLYERVNAQLEKISNQYDRLTSERDRLTGDKLAQNLAEENKLLQRQVALQQEKQKIQEKEAADLRKELTSSFGVQFDNEGFISNYADIYTGLVKKVNSIGAKYSGLTSQEQQDAVDKEYEAATKALDNFNKKYQRYDELWSGDLEDTKSQIEDLKDSIEDLHISVLKTQIEALDNLKDIQESLVDFDRAFNRGIKLTPYQEAADNVAKLGKYFDVATMSVDEYYDNLIKKQEDAANAAGTSDAYKKWSAGRVDELKAAKQRALNGDKSVDYYGTGYFDMSMKNLTDINAQMKQFEETGKSDIFGENSADLYDVAKTVYEQAAGLAQDYWSLIENLHDNVMDMIDDISDKMDRRKDQYEAITDELEHWLDITEMLHGEESYDDLNTILGAQQNNYKAQLNELMQQRDIWKDMLGSMKEGSEEWNEVSDKIKDATSDINDLIQNSLENLQKQYSNTVSKITKAWGTKAVGTDLDWMNTQWELINRNADYYLDDVNKSYNIQKLQSKYLDLLDGSNDLAIQQKISAQMKEQLEYLRDKTKLSEYDVNYANAQLEILQKQIALEEAQRNKSQMKLRRDTQGNYSYVYTANDDNVRSAQSDLLDAQNNAYNMSKDQMKQTQADSLSALQDAQSTVNDIWNNANLSLEEKTKRTQAIIDSLKEYLAGTSEQLSTSQKNIINDFIGMCDMLTGENKDNLQDVYDQIVNGSTDAFDQIDTRWSTSLTSWLQNMDQFKADTDKMLGDLTQAGKDYADGTKTIADLAKTNFDDISNSISGTTDKTKELADSTKEFVNILKDVSGEVKKTESTMTDYANRITDANNNMQAFKQLADETANKLSKKEQENANLSEALKQAEQKNYNYEHYGNANGPSSGGGGGGAGANEDTAWGIAKAIWTYGWASGWGNDPVRSSKLTGAYGTAFARHVQDIINQYSRSGKLVDYGSMKYSSKNLIGYDTGGYTGSWFDKTADAKNGKLAVLHQKELVLNATDTQNILAAVESVRSFADSLKSTSLAQSLSTALGAVSGAKANNASETIDQNVHITAEFPAANSAAEIESALMSLNDRAVQYAYKFR